MGGNQEQIYATRNNIGALTIRETGMHYHNTNTLTTVTILQTGEDDQISDKN